MPKQMSPYKTLEKLLLQHRVLNIKTMTNKLKRSKRSIFRDLSKLKYYSSYSHAGKYYTLEKIAVFNTHGVWHFDDISFSCHGTLKNTVLHLIENSDTGITHGSIESILHLRVQNVLFDLVQEGHIQRIVLANVYHYFNKDIDLAEVAKIQETPKTIRSTSSEVIDDIQAIKILTELIKQGKDMVTAESIKDSLQRQGIEYKASAIQEILSTHQIGSFPGYEVIRYIDQYRKNLSVSLHSKTLFPQIPTIRFRTRKEICSCGGKLTVQRTVANRKILTLLIGRFEAHETIMVCRNCKKVYRSEQLQKIVPDQANFGYDVIVYVGEAIFLHYKDEMTILHELEQQNIVLSRRQIGYLGMKFIIYLAILHRNNHGNIKKYMNQQGGYILHLDGTLEGDSPYLMTTIDEISNIVLDSIKLPSENADTLIPFLHGIRKTYGVPLGVVHDMGKGILNAVQEVFPESNDYICHFHFLRDLGKDFFEHEHKELRQYIRKYKIKTSLRRLSKDLIAKIHEDERLSLSYRQIIAEGVNEKRVMDPVIQFLLAIEWVLNSHVTLQGLGFPFDRIYLNFYQRLSNFFCTIRKFKIDRTIKIANLEKSIAAMLEDKYLKKTVKIMQKKIKVFDRLRRAMRIALPDSTQGLTDKGATRTNIKTIELRVRDFCADPKFQEKIVSDTSYSAFHQQIAKYWDKLFADPIRTTTPEGVVLLQPQRTNNLMEQFFRDFKRCMRKKTGNKSLTKEMKALLHDTPLVKNLRNDEYMKLIMGNHATLTESFAEVDSKIVAQELKKKKAESLGITKKMKELFKIKNLPEKILSNRY